MHDDYTTVQATHLGACVVALGRVPAPELPVGQPLEPALEGAAVQVHEGLNQAEGTVGCCSKRHTGRGDCV